MQQQQKDQVKDAVAAYIQQHNLTAAEMATKADMPAAYLSNILNGKYSITNTVIADKYFAQLAEAVGYALTIAHWKTVPTVQFKEIITTLEASKASGTTAMIIADTGSGKTFTVDRFVVNNPLHTYRITVSDMHRQIDIINDIRDAMGTRLVENCTSNLSHLRAMVRVLKDIKLAGGSPQIIVDEAENMKAPIIKTLKALYDAVNQYCSIVVVGTSQFERKLIRQSAKDSDGWPQFHRRFKGNTRRLPAPNVKSVIAAHTSDKGLQALLLNECTNYGDLHDMLEPALREAARLGQELTEDLFRTIHNLPPRK